MRKTLIAAAALTAAMLLAVTSSAAGGAKARERAGTIAFWGSTGFSSPNSLYVIHPDGSGLRRLTRPCVADSAGCSNYAWSPDRRLIAYVDGVYSLYLVRADGKGRRLLLSGWRLSTRSLSWSPDGKTIAIASAGPYLPLNTSDSACPRPATIYLVPISGKRPKVLPVRNAAGCFIAWSPRGDEIAYWAGRLGISLIHPDGTDRRRIPHSVAFAQWSADGRQLLFEHRNSQHQEFAVAAADDTHFHVVATHVFAGFVPVWSPQGHRIIYGTRKGIYVVGAKGRHDRRVISDSFRTVGSVAWSPDGTSIVYDRDGDLYIVGADGRGRGQLTTTLHSEWAPSWVAH